MTLSTPDPAKPPSRQTKCHVFLFFLRFALGRKTGRTKKEKRKKKKNKKPRPPHLDHVELCDAVLLHAHRHRDAVLLDQHGCLSIGSPSDPVRACVCVFGSLYPSSMFKQRGAGGQSFVFSPEDRREEETLSGKEAAGLAGASAEFLMNLGEEVPCLSPD